MKDLTASLTLTGPIDVLAKLMASISGTAVAVSLSPPMTAASTFQPQPAPAAGDDDESGDQPVAAGTLDKDGLQHDTRIHSDPAKLTTKGVWRKRRGVTDQDVATVEADLRARMGGQSPAPVPQFTPPPVQQPQFTPPPVQQPQFTPPTMQTGLPPVQQFTPPAPVQQPQFTPPPAIPTDFTGFMSLLQPLLSAGKVNAEYLAGLVPRINQAAQLNPPWNAITDVASRPDMIGYVWQTMQADGVTN